MSMPTSRTTSTTQEADLRYRIFRLVGRGIMYFLLAVWGFIAVVPFFWMLSTSVMDLGEAVSGKFVTSNKLLERFTISDEELNTTMDEFTPDFLREKENLTPSELRMTASEFLETEDAYWRIGNSVYRGGLVNYVAAWRAAEFNEYIWNSVQITVITLGGELIFSILAAYAFARMNWPGRNLIFGLLLSTLMIPGMVTIIPNFLTVTWLGRVTSEVTAYTAWWVVVLIMLIIGVLLTRRVIAWLRDPDKQLLPVVIFSLQLIGALLFVSLSIAAIYHRRTGALADVQANWIPLNSLKVFWNYLMGIVKPIPWINNWPALTIPFMGSIFSIFMLRQFFAQIPDDLFDAAQIDGAGHWKFLWSVALPLSTAPILVITVLSFIGTWNALAWPLLVTNTPDWRPIAVGLYNFVDDEAGSEINLQMAGAVITIIPILILYFITQRQFTESIARTGLKG